MKILVLGSGAREHALAARFAAEPGVDAVVCAPGNPGMAKVGRTTSADLTDPDSLIQLAARERADLTVVGPELPLSAGVVDRFSAAGLPILGPSRAAAALESSKAFAKAFMARHGVPTARFKTTKSVDEALAIVRSGELGSPIVVKADGLAAGKGVVIAEDAVAAEAAVLGAMRDRRFGDAGETLVIEECLGGHEASFFVLSDGTRALAIGSAQDHKRILDDDRGPNTGGMGAFAPSPLIDEPMSARIMREIVDPVISGMAADGHPFRGFLYVGLMQTMAGPRVIEFNVRLGDPEAQVILPLVDEPIVPLLVAAASGDLRQASVRFGRERHVGIVLASRGYPEASSAGQSIEGIEKAERVPGVTVYHGGTALRDGRLVTAGGRVLTVVGRGVDFTQAVTRAYAAVLEISFDGMQFRHDIGRKAVAAEAR